VGFSPDGKTVITSSRDSTIRMWNVADSEPISEPLKADALFPIISFSPDGSQFISSTKSNSIAMWKSVERTRVGELHGHEDTVLGAVFSLDGTQIISGSLDGTIRIWDVADQTQVLSYPQVYFESWRGTGASEGDGNEIPEFALALYDLLRTRPNQISILGGWIRIPGPSPSKRIWIPPRYRGALCINAGRVCLGTPTGHVVFVDMTEGMQ